MNSETHQANGVADPPAALDIAELTRTLTEFAITREIICVVSERPDGVTLCALGRVVCVTDRVAILSRRKGGSSRDAVRGSGLAGETFLRLETITRVERLHPLRGAEQ